MPPSYSVLHDHSQTATANGSSGTYGILQNVTTDTNNALSVASVNGNSSNVGQAITLANGSTVTVNSDGGFVFAPVSASAYNDYFVCNISDTVSSANMSVYFTVTNNTPTISSVSFNTSSPKTNDTLTATASASDSDGDTITYQYVWTVNYQTVRTYSTTSATDSLNLSTTGNGNRGDTIMVSVNVTDGIATTMMPATATATVVNSAPTVTNPGSLSAMRGDPISRQISATDVDGDSLTYSASGLPSGLTINGSTGIISGTVSSSASTDNPYSVSVTVSDANGGSANRTFDWTILPAFLTIDQVDQYSVAGESVEVELYSLAAENHTLTFSATGLPSGLSINSSTGAISGTIAYGEASDDPYTVTVTATDSAADASTEREFAWYVASPEILIDDPGETVSVIGAEISMPMIAWSTDGIAITFSATGLPSGLTIDSDTGVISGTIANNANVNSPYTVTVTATNEAAEISESVEFDWIVGQLTAVAVPNQTGYLGDVVELQVVAYYAGNDTLIYSAQGLPAGLSIDTETGEITGVVANDAETESPYSVVIVVTDGTFSASREFDWTIHNPEITLVDPGDQIDVDGADVYLDLSAYSDADHECTFAASDLPDGLSIDEDTGVISGTIEIGTHSNGPFSVTITVTDANFDVSDSQTLTWTVVEALLSNPGTQHNLVGDGVMVSFFATGPFEDLVIYSASGLPGGLVIDSENGVISGTISSNAYSSSPCSVTVTATDGNLTATRTFTWTVDRMEMATLGDQYSADSEVIEFGVFARSSGGGSITFSATGLPTGLSISSAAGVISGTIDEDADENGPYEVTVTATDANSVSVSKEFTWTVGGANSFLNQPYTINNYRESLRQTFSLDLRRALETNNESRYWSYHHTYEVGSHGNGQILAQRLWDAHQINVHQPMNVVLVPNQVHQRMNYLNMQWWDQQMRENGWRTRAEAYRNVNLNTYMTFQDRLYEEYREFVIHRSGGINGLNRVRRRMGLPAYVMNGANLSIGSAQALANWRRDQARILGRWGRAAGITVGAIAMFGFLQQNAATAAQIANPDEQTQAALDDLLNRYQNVLMRRMNGAPIFNIDQDYMELTRALNTYLERIQVNDTIRAAIFREMSFAAQ